MNETRPDPKYLTIYLDDHLAGATAGAQRAARLAEAEAESAEAAALATFADDVAADLDALRALMQAMEIEPSRLKTGLASVAEKVGALKPNGHLAERSPLSPIVELEAMQMAVRGKRSLWETLLVAAPQRQPIDIHELIARADAQLTLLVDLHRTRVARSFASEPLSGAAGHA